MSEPMTSVPVPAAMPSEDIERILRRHLDADEAIADILRDIVNDVQALFAPILAEKEREIADLGRLVDYDTKALADTRARALAAEAALAGERERAAGKVLVPVDALDLVLENVRDDCGPFDGGWKSRDLLDAFAAIAAAIRAQGE